MMRCNRPVPSTRPGKKYMVRACAEARPLRREELRPQLQRGRAPIIPRAPPLRDGERQADAALLGVQLPVGWARRQHAAAGAVTVRLRRLKSPDADQGRGFEIVDKGRSVARVTLKNDLGPTIGYIEVDDVYQRRGLATKLYEAAAKEACRWLKSPLYSDYERSAAAQAFWEKQVRKGRATCERPWGTRAAVGPAYDSIIGRGGCWRYKLTCPAPASLARAGRKR